MRRHPAMTVARIWHGQRQSPGRRPSGRRPATSTAPPLVPHVVRQRAGRRTGLRHGATPRLSGAAHQQARRWADTLGATRRARAPSLPSVNARFWPAGAGPRSGPDRQRSQRTCKAATVNGQEWPSGPPGGHQAARVTGLQEPVEPLEDLNVLPASRRRPPRDGQVPDQPVDVVGGHLPTPGGPVPSVSAPAGRCRCRSSPG